jgi:hypothetical protein
MSISPTLRVATRGRTFTVGGAARIAEYDKAIAHAAREDARSKRLMERPGIGPVTVSERTTGSSEPQGQVLH